MVNNHSFICDVLIVQYLLDSIELQIQFSVPILALMQSEQEQPQSNFYECAMGFSHWNLPDPQKFGLFPWGWGLRLHLQTVYVGNGNDSSSHVPRQTHEGAQRNQYTHPEQVQMVACTFLQ